MLNLNKKGRQIMFIFEQEYLLVKVREVGGYEIIKTGTKEEVLAEKESLEMFNTMCDYRILQREVKELCECLETDVQEIVINRCFGGFGLSVQAQKAIAGRKGFELFFYKQVKYKHRDGVELYRKLTEKELAESPIFIASITKDCGDFARVEQINEFYYRMDNTIERDDKDLIAVVKELGEAANDSCASLCIVEVPKGVNWTISEYDGQESVEEQHRSW